MFNVIVVIIMVSLLVLFICEVVVRRHRKKVIGVDFRKVEPDVMELEVKLRGVGLSPSGDWGMILEEESSGRMIPIGIAPLEAERINKMLELKKRGEKTWRPLTHDFMCSVAQAGDLKPVKVVISETKTVPGTVHKSFFSKVYFEKKTVVAGEAAVGSEIIDDARPSDSVPFAVAADIPIFVEETVLEEEGMLPGKDPVEGGGSMPCGGEGTA